MIVSFAASLRLMMAELVSTGNFLDGLTVRLFINPATPDGPTSVLGDFTEASFDGYAPISLPGWGLPWSDVVGNAVVSSNRLQWTMTGSTTPQTVYGWFATKGTSVSEVLYMAERFDSTYAMAGPGNAVVLDINYGLPGPTASGVTGN